MDCREPLMWLDEIKWLLTFRLMGLFRTHCASFHIHSFVLAFFPFIFNCLFTNLLFPCENVRENTSDAKQKKHVFFNKKTLKKKHCQKIFLCFFIIIYNLKAGKCFLILWSAYSCYIQVVKHYIQYVNCIFIDSVINYLMNYNTNLHSNIKLHNYNL